MKEKSWKDKARDLISNHYLFFMIVGILIISILVPLIILICKNANVFGCDFEGWMCFFGGYAGGILWFLLIKSASNTWASLRDRKHTWEEYDRETQNYKDKTIFAKRIALFFFLMA